MFTIAKMSTFRAREDRDQKLSSPSLGSLAIRSILGSDRPRPKADEKAAEGGEVIGVGGYVDKGTAP